MSRRRGSLGWPELVLLAIWVSGCAGSGRPATDSGAPDLGRRDVGSEVFPSCETPGAGVVRLSGAQVEAVLDPYDVAPLSALVIVREAIDLACVDTISVVVVGRDGDEDLTATLPYDADYTTRWSAPEHVSADELGVPVLGLYAAYDNTVRVEVTAGATTYVAELTLSTEALHESLPAVDVVTAEPAAMEPGWNLAGFSAGEGAFQARPFLFDLRGHIRWVLGVDRVVGPGFVTPMERLRNGNLLFAIGDSLYELSMLGREVARWLLPDGFSQHHDVFEMPDGAFLVCARGRDTLIRTAAGDELHSSEDQVVELDRQTGEVRNVWDLRRFLDIDRYTYMRTGDGHDWYHLNAVVYDAADDSIVVSGKHQGVAKISRGGSHPDDPYRGKELRWILAPHLGWERAGFDGTGLLLAPYLLVAVGEDGAPLPDSFQNGTTSDETFGWVFGQHAPALLPNGDVFLFDNGWGRDLHRYRGGDFSRGVVYRVESGPGGVGGTIQQVWDYGRERGPELYAPVISDVDVGPATGNLFVLPGSYTTRPDGTPGGVAKMVEIRPDDRRVVFEAHLLMRGEAPWGDDICYRMERMTLYP